MHAACLWAVAIAKKYNKNLKKPKWASLCEDRILPTLRKVTPCLPLYTEVLKAMKQEDFKPKGLIVNPEAQAKLGKFYLCCAYALKPNEVAAANEDSRKLLQLARETAEAHIEPWIATVREFVEDYDSSLAQKLQEAAALKASDEPSFWRLSFEAATAERFRRFVQQAETEGQAKGDQQEAPSIPEGLDGLAEAVYLDWLEASAQPIKGELRDMLEHYGLLVV